MLLLLMELLARVVVMVWWQLWVDAADDGEARSPPRLPLGPGVVVEVGS